MASPTDKMVNGSLWQHTPQNHDTSLDVSDDSFLDWKHTIARKNGLKLPDVPIIGTADIVGLKPREAGHGTSDLLGMYGVTMTVASSEKQLKGIDGSPIDANAYWNDKKTLTEMLRLRQIFQKYPTDFFVKLGIKKVVIMNGDKDVEIKKDTYINVLGEVSLSEHPGSIFLDQEGFESFDHEVVHVIDDATGCLRVPDKQYAKINNGLDIYADTRPANVYSQEQFKRANSQRITHRQKRVSTQRQFTATEYGFTNEHEDKADLGQSLFDFYHFSQACFSGSNILRDKFNLLLTRVRLWNPDFGSYLLTVNQHCENRDEVLAQREAYEAQRERRLR